MITCPACGTDNREWASHCGECGKPLPDDARRRARATDAPATERLPDWLRRDAEERPRERPSIPDATARGNALPPIPDGGLADAMPSWLAGHRPGAQSAPALRSPDRERGGASGDTPDVTAFLSPEDLPAWLRRLAEVETHPTATSDDQHPAPVASPTQPLIGDAPDEIAAAAPNDLHSPPASISEAPNDAATRKPPSEITTPPSHDVSPGTAPATDRRLTAVILAVVAIAAAMIAYAVYLGAAG